MTREMKMNAGYGSIIRTASLSESVDIAMKAPTKRIGLWATDIVLAFGRRLGDTPAMAGLRIG